MTDDSTVFRRRLEAEMADDVEAGTFDLAHAARSNGLEPPDETEVEQPAADQASPLAAPKRKKIGKRLRFEILKRDGFRCRYCGATPVTSLLHVDHVVPVAEGGTNDPANLVAACSGCNLGKSDVTIEESRITAGTSAEAIRERTEQVREYIAALQGYEAAREELREFYARHWRERTGDDPPTVLFNRFDMLDAEVGFACLMECFDAVGTWIHRTRSHRADHQTQYFYGVLRNRRAR